MIRMAITHAVRRGLAEAVHRHWRRGEPEVADVAMWRRRAARAAGN